MNCQRKLQELERRSTLSGNRFQLARIARPECFPNSVRSVQLFLCDVFTLFEQL